eukprot:scaffold12427_cov51-Cyclotella_meneghiniana.AAC.1
MMLQRSDGQIHANSQSKCFDGRCVIVHTTYRWRWSGISHAYTYSNKATSNVSCIMTCSFAAVGQRSDAGKLTKINLVMR